MLLTLLTTHSMSCIPDRHRIPRDKDRRRRLTDLEKEEIKGKYIPYITSYNMLAREYNVSKRLIMFIINPEKKAINSEQFKERRKDGRYYNREKHTKAVRSLRAYKREVLNLPYYPNKGPN
jgi:hypothetical protein